MTFRRALVIIAACIAALAAGQLSVAAEDDPIGVSRAIAAEQGLKLGPVPEVEGALTVADLPDLIPVGEGDKIWGYAYAEEAFVELFDPDAEFLGYGVYRADGRTLLGHVVAGKGFVAGTKPIETSRRAIQPDLEAGLTAEDAPVD